MNSLLNSIGQALLMSAAMFWQVGWSLALGFTITSVIEIAVSKDSVIKKFGKSGFREVALATGFGAISSSCSYAAASTSRALFKKGASLIASLAFLFSSTNLVIELGIILWLLMGWQFAVAEWIGGIFLIAIMSLLVKITYPKKLVEEARTYNEPQSHHHHHHEMNVKQESFLAKMKSKKTISLIAKNYYMEWSMLWKDLLIGFLIAGFVSVFVPHDVWNFLFFKSASPAIRIVASALIAPVIAILTFVCSIGNVPLAAILWAQGLGFSGVLSFLYSDLIVFPLLDVYRKYYGWKMMGYIFLIFFITMATTGLIMYLPFNLFHLIPAPDLNIKKELTVFRFNYTFFLNIGFGMIALYFFYLKRKIPVKHDEHSGHHTM